jgi:HSP20 family protein
MSLVRRTPRMGDLWPFGSRQMEWPEWIRSEKGRMFGGDGLITVEEFQDGDDFVVRAEVPGVDPDKDIEVSVADRTLHIRAEKREEQKTEDMSSYRSEFRYGSFTRSLSLPTGADADAVKASYRDGVLEVRVHVDEVQSKGAKVPVEHG